MADTQQAPHPATQPISPNSGSVEEAREALLSLLDPEEETPVEEEATPTEEEESTEETQDESFEEESEEEDEESDEDYEDESEESAEDQEEEEEPLFTVTANGEEIEVTYDELLKGYSRQADYTQKTQQLSNLRNEYEAAKQQYQQSVPELDNLKQQYSSALGQLINDGHAGLERFNIDWQGLKDTDSEKYLMMRDEFNQARDSIERLKSKKQHEDQQIHAQQAQQLQQVIAHEHEAMVRVLPDWADPGVRSQIAQSVKQYGLSVGYTEQELSNIVDHRQLLSLLKAMRFDSVQEPELKAKKIKNKPKVMRSGKGKSKSSDSKRGRAKQMKRLQGSGHLSDASVLLEDFIDI